MVYLSELIRHPCLAPPLLRLTIFHVDTAQNLFKFGLGPDPAVIPVTTSIAPPPVNNEDPSPAGLEEDTITSSRRKRKRSQGSFATHFSDSSSSEMRLTVAELEMEFGKTILKRQLFHAEKERD
ncbi:unnamed protein product [Ilex paraguariensis]|uniref:Uncharacterized protein n=1 Tax=Ilex paraguariensis TaxID=185542 RepID=A0ABC8TQ82_9AQUA